jgi:hypothetical protein
MENWRCPGGFSMINRKAVFGAALSILASITAGYGQLIFPHFAQGAGYQTTFTLTNLSNIPATCTLQVFLETGAPVTNLVILLAPNGTGKAALTGTGLTVGWARVTLPPPAMVTGLETIELIDDGSVIAEASFLPVSPASSSELPVIERSGIATGLALANPGTASATVNLLLRDQSGVEIAAQTFSIDPSRQVARFVAEFFRGIQPFEGSVEVSASPAIAVVALKQLSSGIFSALPSASPSAGSSDPFFSPGGGIASRIVREIQRAGTSIDIAIYEFSETQIANSLVAAKNRGVSIRIIADSGEATVTGSVIGRLENAGIPVKRSAGIGAGIMHNKYAIFDGRVLLTGSYNWSVAAEAKNFENAIFLHDAAAISSYQSNFNSIWNR